MCDLKEKPMKCPETFDFPFPPYNIQHEFMTNLYNTINDRKLGIFESPTGTGKSLSIICGAIRWLKDYKLQEKATFTTKIKHLEDEKKKLESNGGDWLKTQARELEIGRKLNGIKEEFRKVQTYEEKFENLHKKRERTHDKKWKLKSKKDPEPETLTENVEELTDEDFLLEDVLNGHLKSCSDEETEEEDKYKPLKIYICSRTHSQLSQFVGEILKSPFAKNIRVVTLASRQNYCINPTVKSLKNLSLINERCLDMQKTTKNTRKDIDGKALKKQKTKSCKCEFFKQQPIEDLRDTALVNVLDVEDLILTGKELKACPYYASRKAAEDAEIVLIPYNTLLHKGTREANGIDLKNNVIIVDEAHNLLEALAQIHGAELTFTQVENALNQLNGYKKRYSTMFSSTNLLMINQLIFVLKKLKDILENKSKTSTEATQIFTLESFVLTAQIDNFNMFKLVKFLKDSKIVHKVRSFSLKNPIEDEPKPAKKGIKSFLESIENQSKKGLKVEIQEIEEIKKPVYITNNPLMNVCFFFECLTYSYEHGRILMHKNTDKNTSKLQFLLLNPASDFSDIVKEARSVIVAGGTMKPIAEFRDRLFKSAGAESNRIVEFSCDHIIPKENILPIILSRGKQNEHLLFNFENRLKMVSSIKSIIEDCCKKIQGGIVVFFPSYKYENFVWNEIKSTNFGRAVFREPQDSSSVETVLEKYADTIKKNSKSGALMLSVVGGKLSEGLNFSDDLGRCVIVIGLPYANIKAADLKEKMSYLDKNEGYGSGNKFYENLCMKSVNQCIGRAVRHKADYATVLLVDERYLRTSTKNALPSWIQRSLVESSFSEAFQKIEKFFVGHKMDPHIK